MLLFRINGIDCHILGHTIKPALKGTSIKQITVSFFPLINRVYNLNLQLLINGKLSRSIEHPLFTCLTV